MMAPTGDLRSQLTQFANLCGKGETIQLPVLVHQFGQACDGRFRAKIVGAVSCVLGSGVAYCMRTDKLRLLATMTVTVVTGAAAAYKYFQQNRWIRETLECCRTTELAVGREVSTFQSALCHEVNTALILLPTEPDTLPTKEQVQQKALQTVIAFFNNQQPDPEHEVGALHNFLSSRYIVAVESQRLKQILSQPQSPCREPQELLKLLTQIHGHLHTMQFGVEWVKDQENAATLHSYFTLIETSKGVYRASINSIARSPAITT